MAKMIKNVKVTWNWSGDFYALKGFNIAITPSSGDPNSNAIAMGTTRTNTTQYTLNNITLDDTIQYTAWVQALYDGGDSDWTSTGNMTITDDGHATIATTVNLSDTAASTLSSANTTASGYASTAQTNAQNYTVNYINQGNTDKTYFNFADALTGTHITGSTVVDDLTATHSKALFIDKANTYSGNLLVVYGQYYKGLIAGDYIALARVRVTDNLASQNVIGIAAYCNSAGYITNSKSFKWYNATSFSAGTWKTIAVPFSVLKNMSNATQGLEIYLKLPGTTINTSIYLDYISIIPADKSNILSNENIDAANASINNLNTDLDNALSDNYITNIEAGNINRDYQAVNSESTNLVSQASSLGITTEKTNYSNAISTLWSSMSSFVGQPTYPIAITSTQRTTIVSSFQNVQTAKSALINKISSVLAGNVQANLDNLQIGATNLFRSSDFGTLNTSYWGTRGTTNTISVDSANQYNGYNSLKIVSSAAGADSQDVQATLIQNINSTDKAIISFYAKASVACNIVSHLGYATPHYTNTLTTSWQQVVIPIDPSTVTQPSNLWFWYVSVAATVWIALPKIEYGTKATAWTPAPADIQQQFSDINTDLSQAFSDGYITNIEAGNINRDYQAINSESTNLITQATNLGISTEKTNYSNTISTLCGNISGFVNQSNYPMSITTPQRTAITSSFQNVQNAKSALINKISSVLSGNVQSNLDNLQIGGRNLITNSNFYNGWTSWSFNGGPTVAINTDSTYGHVLKVVTTASSQGPFHGVSRIPGNTYAWSVMLKADAACNVSINNESGTGSQTVALTTSWQRFTGTGVWNGPGGNFTIYSSTASTFYVANVKYEDGAKATTWTPAPEDVQSQVDTINNTTIPNAQSAAQSYSDTQIGINQWLVKRYNKTTNAGTIPDYSTIQGINPAQSLLINDTGVINGPTVFGSDLSNYIGTALTYVYCNTAYTLNLTTLGHDDGGAVYLNGSKIYGVGAYINDTASLTINFLKGWNKLELMWCEHTGGDMFTLNTTLSTNSNISKMTCLLNVDNISEGRLVVTENTIFDMSNDNKLTPTEKQSLIKDWNNIQNEKATIDAQADLYGSSRTTYDTNYNTLSTYIAPLLTDLTTTSDIVGSTFRTNFSNYYSAKNALLQDIINKTKTYTDDSVNNIQIGGRNLILNSGYFSNVNNWSIPSTTFNNAISANGELTITKFASNSGVHVTVDLDKQVTSGQQYTLSALVKDSIAGNTVGFSLESGSGLWVALGNVVCTNANTYYPITYTFTADSNGAACPHIAFSSTNMALNEAITIQYIKLEEGNKATDWSPALADTTTAISQAQSDANDANSSITDINNDNTLTPAKKTLVKKDFDIIVSEKPNIDAQADVYGITTEKSNYDTSYTTLYNYVNPFFASMTTNSSISGSTLRNDFTDYYNKKALLLKKISDTAKSLADGAQSTANTANTSANNAQSTANSALMQGDIITNPIFSQWSAVWPNGYTNFSETIVTYATTLSAATTVGATSITVASATNIRIGTSLTIGSENKTVSAVSGTTITLSSGLASAHASGTAVNGSNNFLTKETSLIRSGGYGLRFNVTTSGAQIGSAMSTGCYISNVNNTQYLYVEIDFLLVSGVLTGAGLLVDWAGMSPYRDTIKLSDYVSSPTLNKWYTIRTVIKRPSDILTGWTGMSGYIMANYSSIGDGVKNIVFDRVSIREATAQEINTYDMSDDNQLTSVEKQSVKQQLDSITNEKDNFDNQANIFGIVTEKTNYDNAYTTLYNYVNPLLSNLSTTSPISGSTLRSDFVSYYNAKAALQQAIANQAHSNTAAAQSAIDNLQIGGTNLLLDSTFPTNTGKWNILTANGITIDTTNTYKNNNSVKMANSGSNRLDIPSTYFSPYISGQNLVLTVWVMSPNVSVITNSLDCWIGFRDNTGTPVDSISNPIPASAFTAAGNNAWFKWTITGKSVLSNALYTTFMLATNNTSATIYVSCPKLEFGTRATDYSPSPVDAQSQLNDISSDNKLAPSEKIAIIKEWNAISSEKDSFDSQASNYGITTELTNYDNAYNNLNLYISPLLSDLTTTSNIVGATLRGNFQSYYDTKAELQKVIANKAKTLADNAQSSIDNLNIGGRNYVPNSKAFTITGTGTSNNGWSLANLTEDLSNKQVTMSFNYSATGTTLGTNAQLIVQFSDNYNWAGVSTIQLNGHLTGSSSFTATLPTRVVGTRKDLWFRLDYVTGAVTISDVKVEIGNRATDWTPAPEDIDAQFTSLNTDLNNALSDSYLTNIEAQTLEKDLALVQNESTQLITQATSLSITTEKTNYSTALTNLANELNNNWINKTGYPLSITSTQRTNINNLFNSVANCKTILLNKISTTYDNKSSGYANTAQNNATDYANQLSRLGTINNTTDTLFHYDNNLCSTNGINPNGGYIVTLRNGEGKFGSAVAVEEGTTNVVPSSTFANIHGYNATNGSMPHASLQPTGYYRIAKMGTTVVNDEILNSNNYTVSAGQTWTESFYFMTDGNMTFKFTFYTNNGHHPVTPTIISLGNNLYRAFATYTVETGGTYIRALDLNTITWGTSTYIDINYVQLEQKSFATSYVNGTRATGKLYYDKSVLNVNNFTICLWCNFPQIHQTQTCEEGIVTSNWYTPIIGLCSQNASNTSGIELAIDPHASGYTPHLHLQGIVNKPGSVALNDNTWYFISMTFDGTTYKVYLNGNTTPEITQTGPAATIYSDSVLMVGGGFYGMVDSIIDELYISSNVLPASDIQAMYNLNKPLYDNSPKVIPNDPSSVTLTVL